MILVVFDTNALIFDRHLKSPRWKQLHRLISSFDVRAATTEISVAEVVANYTRAVHDVQNNMRSMLKDPSIRHLDLDAPTVFEQLAADVDSYPQRFRGRLTAFGVEVLGLPDVPHDILVHRATLRIRPNDHKGDGYRDTLIWMRVLEEAEKLGPDDKLIFVTQDNDFRSNNGLHDDLTKDLKDRSITCQVTVARSADDAITTIQDIVDPDNALIAGVEAKLNVRRLMKYVGEAAFNQTVDIHLSAADLALPARAARVQGCTIMDWAGEPQITVSGQIDDGVLVVVDGEAVANIDYESVAQAVDETTEEQQLRVTRNVNIIVDVQVSPDAAPKSATLTRLTATKTDAAIAAMNARGRLDIDIATQEFFNMLSADRTTQMLTSVIENFQRSQAAAINASLTPLLEAMQESTRSATEPLTEKINRMIRESLTHPLRASRELDIYGLAATTPDHPPLDGRQDSLEEPSLPYERDAGNTGGIAGYDSGDEDQS